jgi:hypothetical protein
MPNDPAFPPATDQAGRTAERLAALERRLASLERGRPAVQIVGAGGPTGAPRDGALAGDTTPRLWLRVGGAWHYATLT